MTFYTVLAFFLASGELTGEPIILRSLQECSDAMDAYIYRDDMRDIDIFCVETRVASSSIRPLMRPSE